MKNPSKKALMALLLWLSFTYGSLFIAQALPAGDPAAKAAQALVKAETFSFGGVGFAGSIAEAEKQFFEIYQSPRSAELLEEVYRRGTPVAKLYALSGLYLKDRAVYETLSKEFQEKKCTVQMMTGCLMSDQENTSILASISKGDFADYIRDRS